VKNFKEDFIMTVQPRYAYYYARLQAGTGLCRGVTDSTDYILDPLYVPIPSADRVYLLKYYWPIPETVTSFDDFQGQWYTDAAHTQIFDPNA
jgi:hypothetical protein